MEYIICLFVENNINSCLEQNPRSNAVTPPARDLIIMHGYRGVMPHGDSSRPTLMHIWSLSGSSHRISCVRSYNTITNGVHLLTQKPV